MRSRPVRVLAAALALAVLGFAAPAFTQTLHQGRIDVIVLDATGALLPGVMVEISGPQAASAITDGKGEARFLSLAPGTYRVRAALTGFSEYVNENVPVGAGASVPLRVQLRLAGVAEAVEVVSASPVVDTRNVTTATNVTLAELQEVPSSRDPWVVLQTVPSIIVDRVNVGGAESGQQSIYFGKGANFNENTWNLDGIPITDMAAVGATPTYYDFDSFQEMQVTTGGADVQNATPGVQLNLVLKQGTNTLRGSARYYGTGEGLQSNNMPDDLAEIIGGRSGKGNRTDEFADYGFDLGGPLMRDRWWLYGSYGKTDVTIRTLIDSPDNTVLENYTLKTQAQLTKAVRGGFTYFRGEKIKFGRDAGPARPPETTWDQGGPSQLYKGEANFVLGDRFFVTARGAFVDLGFFLTPQGGIGPSAPSAYRDEGNVWHNSYIFADFKRPVTNFLADANWFSGRHEVKFGVAWKNAKSDTINEWPGTGAISIHLPGYSTSRLMVVQALRPFLSKAEATYNSVYIADTISYDRLTVNLGLRYDHANASVSETTQAANPLLPDILPSITAPAVQGAVKVGSLTPRIGVTYALDERRKTLARASYAIFGSQLGSTQGAIVSGASYAFIQYLATDVNGNGTTERDEINFGARVGFGGFDPANPSATRTFNRVDDNLSAPRTHEIIVGIDRELRPNFGLSGSFSWRHFGNTIWTPLIGVRRPDYRFDGTLTGSLPSGESYSVDYYALDSASKIPPGSGVELTNRPGYYQRYWGFELQATKRMSDRWMGRIGFSTNDHREYFPDPDAALVDPTPTPGSPNRHGELVVRQTGGSGKSQIFLVQPRYQFIANGVYQAPWDINLGANLVTRQGYSMPYHRASTTTTDPLTRFKTVLVVSDLEDQRLPAVTSLDVRISKAFRFGGRFNTMFDLDFFNLGNIDTVLGRQYNLNATGQFGADRVLEIMNPRIIRFGVRFNF